MSFNPGQFVNKPLLEVVQHLGQLDPDEFLPHGEVELYSSHHTEAVTCRPADMLVTTVGNTDVAENHPDVDVPGVTLVHFLGGGGQGWVYAGKVQTTGTVVAVKVLRGDLGPAQNWAIREASLCARVRHPNILRVFRAEKAAPYWVVIMEMIQGKELDKSLLTPSETRACLARIADGLVHLHRQHIVHRDVKPTNILLRKCNHQPVLVDFGIAWDLDEAKELATLYGTPYYMPPEAFRPGLPNYGWDAYSLGVTGASVLGLRQSYDTLGQLQEAKRNGAFDRTLKDAVASLEDAQVRDWLLDLIASEPERRRQALEQSQARLAA